MAFTYRLHLGTELLEDHKKPIYGIFVECAHVKQLGSKSEVPWSALLWLCARLAAQFRTRCMGYCVTNETYITSALLQESLDIMHL